LTKLRKHLQRPGGDSVKQHHRTYARKHFPAEKNHRSAIHIGRYA
jgi:hypothetical protein